MNGSKLKYHTIQIKYKIETKSLKIFGTISEKNYDKLKHSNIVSFQICFLLLISIILFWNYSLFIQ